jgi:hypothetical protein
MDLVSANAVERTLEVDTARDSGTAFTIDHLDRQYLVTARHLLPEGEASPEVTLSNRTFSRTLNLDLLPVRPSAADVAVAPLDEPLTIQHPLPATTNGLVVSQRVFFLGFPKGLEIQLLDEAPTERLAFIRGATFSAMAQVDLVRLVYLDGTNTPGS